MKISLIEFTGSGHADPAHHAAALLAFTKATRLKMSAGGFEEFKRKQMAELLKELEYMANTIPSSWEFVHYTFMVEGVTRAFTHQFVRTRTASFAQQTMRVLDVSEGRGWEYGTGPTIKNEGGDQLLNSIYSNCMDGIAETYKSLLTHGAAIEDARGILPTNILTNIVMDCNMRTFVELVRKRSSSRTQGEYRDVLEGMKEAVRAVHPWIDLFIERTADRAINDLEGIVKGWKIEGRIPKDDETFAVKLLDQLRAQL